MDANENQECWKTTPNLTKFTAVEKDVSCMRELEQNVKKYLPGDIMVDLHLAPAQKWQGPLEKADLVFSIHSIYYFKEEDRKVIFENCFNKWLKPNGKLFILMNKDKFDTPTPYYLNDIFRETGRVPLIESYIVKKELLKLGCTIDRSFHYQYYQDLQAGYDHAVPFVMIHANPPYENEEVPKKAIMKLIKRGNKGYASGTMFSVIEKY
ncbi:hypothetical protein HELRODRAFT_177826 [Helobdella robusta]|uniref:Methyltransferase type 11 domain-containing protein n=1 Tax=Helobdella robusta TaxID=6412 RepID=T1FCB9_HELRO|nr:hypothetical protein HELRODRAFT_177826 [Helobdella robusta]ESN97763.1 hypothetical protein HELRODRAFT_177826 [Helobdella robusta]